MKNRIKLILFSLFFSNIPKLSSSITCDQSSCPRDVNMSKPTVNISIRHPFHIKNLQPELCGKPGFDLLCDKTLGTVIQLPNGVVLRVDSIYYYDRYMVLSDPQDCLPKKLLSLDLTKTPFYPHEVTEKIWVYNCSGNYNKYDRIDCLSGVDFTVISSGYNIIRYGDNSNCTLVKTLTVSVSSADHSGLSRIELAWKGNVASPAHSANYSILTTVGLILGLTSIMAGLILFCYRFFRMRNQQTTTATATTNTNSTPVVGLDQIIIDSYPVEVVGESGWLINPDDDTCPICLSDYQPHDTLKILPECLHRFHADCIDQWLRSKGICPICRAALPS